MAAGNLEMISEQEYGPRESESGKEGNSNKDVFPSTYLMSDTFLQRAAEAPSCWDPLWSSVESTPKPSTHETSREQSTDSVSLWGQGYPRTL